MIVIRESATGFGELGNPLHRPPHRDGSPVFDSQARVLSKDLYARDSESASGGGCHDSMTPSVPARASPPAIPSLDAIAADPSKADGLPPTTARALLARCAVVQSALLGPALSADMPQRETSATRPSSDNDTLLDRAETARRMKVPETWLSKRGSRLPFALKLGHRTLRYSATGLEKWLAARRH